MFGDTLQWKLAIIACMSATNIEIVFESERLRLQKRFGNAI